MKNQKNSTEFHLMFEGECDASDKSLRGIVKKIARSQHYSDSLKAKVVDGITDNMDKILSGAKEGKTGQVVVTNVKNMFGKHDRVMISITH